MLYDGFILALFSIAIATISGLIVNQMTQIAALAKKSTCEMFSKETLNVIVPSIFFVLAAAQEIS